MTKTKAKVLSTGCSAIDGLMFGGLPLGAPSLLFGMSNLGKTWFSFQVACMCVRDAKYGGLNKKALYFDTESFFTPAIVDLFWDYFEKRWPDLKGKKDMIEIVRVPDIFKLMRQFGVALTIIQENKRVSVVTKFPTSRQRALARSGKSKLKETTQSSGWLIESPVWKRFKDENYGLMIIDSMTVPIKSQIPSLTQNFPARATILTHLLGTFYSLAISFDAAILVTDHISQNPQDPYSKYGKGNPWGGSNVTYYIKHQFGLFPSIKEQREKYPLDAKRLRRISLHRMPGREVKMVLTKLEKDTGYVDVEKTGVQPA